MMRIIAGRFRGRRLKPPSGARATAGRVREAWFNILAPELDGASVVDLFAGSGALGLEALSRGAAMVVFVERARRSLSALEANVKILGAGDRVKIQNIEVFRYLAGLDRVVFDVAFADPPYGTEYAASLLRHFRERPFARILGIEHSASIPLAGDDSRRYGEVGLTFCYAP